ncbi:hypothetical protein CHS0354_017394 [Potamilus streckersoni]|uniref:Uncharacterized protein n=1 Tax=Potamilus streckersoni TaxID=2493646 RepID=A0AAE0W790_9BIVA|nr:hypothetical protein CHS0354_017394 [Potamilus streckersoni]
MPSCYDLLRRVLTPVLNDSDASIRMSPHEEDVLYKSTNQSFLFTKEAALLNLTEFDSYNVTNSEKVEAEIQGILLKNVRMIKLAVLGVVVVILLLSTCRFVFKLFSKYTDSDRKDDMD